ncbi:phage tail assembly protein [Pseudomonas mosselii]|uniref:phage tail assembly protein n=1 Tax=Pseudomonas mosselii TaxID=78327 RepID=UPI001F4BDF0F|nr:phage tail assembly protein [Pseudomonas mosselii]MCH7418557.1 phage tail assembly protein [Pseudomonas mosselii]
MAQEKKLPQWLTVDAERVTVRLSRPSEANGVQVDSLSLRAPTVRDIRNAQVGGVGDDEQRELNLFASLAEVGVKDLEGLALKDYSRLQTGYFRLVQDDEV